MESVKRAAITARVSSEEQAKNSSIPDQIARGKVAAEQRGWTVAGTYADEGVTGTTADRPEWQRLLADCRAGKIDVVIATKWDRLARNAMVGLEIAAELERLNVDLVVLEADFDTSTPTGKMMRHVLVGFAAFDRDTLVEKMGRGQRAMAERGGWPGGNQAPYGYRAVGGGRDNRLEINADEATILRQAIAWIVEDQMTTGQVASRLNAAGMLTRKGRLWTHQNLRRHFVERTLLGEVLWGRMEKTHRSTRASGKYGPPVLIQYEPIISTERFDALQRAMAIRARGVNKPRKTYPLSGRLICFCGEPFGGAWRADRDLRQYRCRAAKWTATGEAVCRARRLDAEWVEHVVWTEITGVLAHPERLMAYVGDYIGLRAHQVQVERDESAEVQARVATLERALARAVKSSYLDDEPEAHAEAVAQIRADLDESRQRRDLLVEWRQESAQQSARMRDVWALAEIATDRLNGMSVQQREQVLALLDVRVSVLDAPPNAPARGGLNGGLGPARPSLHIGGSVPHERLLDMIVEGRYPVVAGSRSAEPPPR
ncbi:MAG: Resolvase domain protein [Frankiales bacterium]|nr:Resolvase domain protein [Frankiales bacterium]